ncbi:MAG: Flp pilus assembly complex ATPase component TadA [Acidobacteria bacterium]|nr:Flp pilus assembly complex ATPase component TadA [Acidobacteriota bacterium]
MLLSKQALSHAQLEAAIAEQKRGAGRLGELLLKKGIIGKDDLAAALAEVSGIAYLDCNDIEVERAALDLVPQEIARRHCALPVKRQGKRLILIMAEPQNLAALDELRFVAGMNLDPRLGFQEELAQAIAHHYSHAKGRDSVADVVNELGGNAELDLLNDGGRNGKADREIDLELNAKDTPAVKLVSAIIPAAIRRGASDIHFEQEPHGVNVRIRVDGVLHNLAEVPAGLRHAIVSRIKILADLDISEKRMPQDGSFLVRLKDEAYDLRVSTLPTQHGEKVVMRILNASGPSAELRDLGMAPDVASTLKGLLHQPQGMILVTGPTGSGKSTTLYSSLKMLRERKLNITTVEDPIEYVLEGITQVQVNARAGRTFASALRSILRQDPNVILVGEIRDQETAEIAVQASQTGHLVLSTLHTNDCFGAIGRLLDLNITRFLLSHSVSAVIGQRLVRKLCSCKVQSPINDEYRRLMRREARTGDAQSQWTAAGCDACGGTGYKGRIGIYELLRFSHAIREALTYEASNDELRAIATGDGFRSMFQQGISLAEAGDTTVEELLRVIPLSHGIGPSCSGCRRAVAAAFRFCPYCGATFESKATAREQAELARQGR